jgi:hypothetical protein
MKYLTTRDQGSFIMASYLPERDVPSDDKVVAGHSDSTRKIAGPIVTPGDPLFSLCFSSGLPE